MSIFASKLANAQDTKGSKEDAAAPQRDELTDPSYRVQLATAARERVAIETYLKNTLDDFWTAKKGLDQAAAMSGESEWQSIADPRLHYAYGLLLLKSNKYDEALKQFASVEAAYLPAMRARIWLNVLREKYESALADLPALLRAVQKASAAESQLSKRDDAEASHLFDDAYIPWVGEIFGFISGPGNSKVSDAKRKSLSALCKTTESEISKVLDDRQRQLFDTGKHDTLDAYAEMTGAQQTARDEGIEKQKQDQAEAKERLDDTKSKLDEEKRQLETKSANADQQHRNDLAAIDSQIAAIDQKKKPLEARGRQLMQQISTMDQEINNLNARRDQALAAKDAASANRIKLTVDQRTAERMARQTDYNQLQAQVDDLNRQAAPLTAKRQALTQQHEKNASNIAKEHKGVDKRAQMVQRGQRDAAKNVTGQTGKTKSAAQAATALRTYVDLDVERERTEIMRSLEPATESAKPSDK
jgi:hypothetical protein